MSLYQKYRPRVWDDVVGQEFVVESLKNAFRLGMTHHAYLLYGSHGIGKTTIARIFAKAANCLELGEDGNPCGKCDHCQAADEGRMLDTIEIDAASHTGVENIRELIEKAQFQPNQGEYKVYIIDEVHMLSKAAFNALLKTLEEPPAHVKFLMATTEVHKIPDTILSRTIRYDLRKISEDDIVAHLQGIADKEGIKAEEEALRIITRYAKGGMRDAISLLEQYVEDNTLTMEYLRLHLHIVDDEFIDGLVDGVRDSRPAIISEGVASLREQGVDVRFFLEQALTRIHERSLAEVQGADFPLLQQLFSRIHEAYLQMKYSPDPWMYLEMVLLGSMNGDKVVEVSSQTRQMNSKQ